MKYFFVVVVMMSILNTSYGQVGINTDTPDASSVLDVVSTSAGAILPRLTEAQRDLIIDPSKALIIFNIDQNCYQYNAGTPATPEWQCFLTNVVRGARGSINFNSNTFNSSGIPTGESTTFTGTVRNNSGTPIRNADNTKKINIPTAIVNDADLFIGRDAANPGAVPNRIQYIGNDVRFFRVTYTISYFATTNNLTMAFYIAKGSGTVDATFNDVLDDSRVYQLSSGTSDVVTVPVAASIELAPGDYIEVWASRYSGGGNQSSIQSIEVSSVNLVID